MKIRTFSQHLEAKQQVMKSLREPSDQEIADAEKYLEEGKDPNWDFKLGYFYIDVSGKYSVYYTLWKESPMENHFITNLSTDFQTAVEKAKKVSGRIPVIIDKTGTKAGLFQAAKAEIVTFGKYRGKTLGDIFIEDPKYIIWLSKNYDGKSQLRSERIRYYADLYYETITKKNQEESKSEWIGQIGDKITIEAEVYAITTLADPRTDKLLYKCKLVDKEGNKYNTYSIGKPVQNGDTVKLSAKVKDHNEYLGVKFTVLNYCKILWNLREDLEKYNV